MEIRFKLVVVATKTYGFYTYKILNRLQGDNPIVETGNFNLEDPGPNSKIMGGFLAVEAHPSLCSLRLSGSLHKPKPTIQKQIS